MTRGEVWTLVRGSRQYRVLIVSNDEYNVLEDVTPWGLIIDRIVADSDLLVPLVAYDPLPGATVDASAVVRVDRSALRDNHGFVGNDTMNRVEYALRDLLNLP